MGTAKTREFKIFWLSNQIAAADAQGISVNKDKLLNEFCLNTFSTIRTGQEILDILIKSGRVFEIEGDIMGKRLHSDLMGNNEQTRDIPGSEELCECFPEGNC